jgi:predicted ATPase/DNA-binding CsgD family transcriptional regulator
MENPEPPAPLEGLSDRELEIVRLVAEGLSDRALAERLAMSVNTIKWYNRQIYSKLGVGSRTQAIARARALGLLEREAEARPAPATVFPAARSNLPVEATRLSGRARETAEIGRALEAARLVTLTGAPGTGKTRLAVHAARELASAFAGGVYFVSLAPIADPGQVAPAVARAIGVNEIPGQPILETVKRALHDRPALLVLDNFEHLLAAAPLVSEVLAATTRLRVLATSREALRLYGEQAYAVPRLEVPDPQRPELDQLAACESVALFVARAKAVRPGFALTGENALDIAMICVRLEGLPLAIELAAARVQLMSPRQLLARLNRRLETLVGGPRDAPPRQQTLRQTLHWSYDLLTAEERALFAQLAVFRGGSSPEAIEAVCRPGGGLEPLAGAESLVNKSLLFVQYRRPAEDPRLLMLETIHEYALAQLERSGEAEGVRQRHAAYCTALAERAAGELRRAGFSEWMARLEADSENVRAALEWSLAGGDVEMGLRLVTALRDYWITSSRIVEGEGWVGRAVPKIAGVSPALQARVLCTAGMVLFYAVQRASGRQFLEQAAALARAAEDRLTLAWALSFRGAFAIGEVNGHAEALAAAQEGLALFRALGHAPGMAQALNIVGELRRTQGDDAAAQAAYEASLALARETGEARREVMILSNLAFIALHRADAQWALSLAQAAFLKAVELGYDPHLVITSTVCVAEAIGARGEPELAARLFGAAAALLEPLGVRLPPGDIPEYERHLGLVRRQLGAAVFEACWAAGRAMSFEQVVGRVRALAQG